jgi:tripartite-type tricarboxylate transporter receptor subunit TctC
MAQFAYRNPGYNADSDFVHLSVLTEALYFLAANPKWRSVEALVAEAKKRPGELVFTSWGVGSVAHLLGVDFCRRNGIEMLHRTGSVYLNSPWAFPKWLPALVRPPSGLMAAR